jgi:DNA polymerase alpha subunit B
MHVLLPGLATVSADTLGVCTHSPTGTSESGASMGQSNLNPTTASPAANPPDVLMLLGPFVDSEHPGLVAGAADRTTDGVLREEVLRRLAAWRADHPAAVVALMPAVRDATALPMLPQPPITATAQALGPADRVRANNPK